MKTTLTTVSSVRIVGFVLFMFLLSSAGLMAQTRGATSQVTQDLSFEKSFEKLNLDPTPLTGPGSRVSFMHPFSNSASRNPGLGVATAVLGAAGISIPGWLTDLTNGVSFFCSGISPTLGLTASVEVGGYYELHSVGTGNVEVNYPVNITVSYPAENTFACGELVTIRTAYTIADPTKNDKLKVDPPFFNQEIGPIFKNLKLGAGIGLDAWVGFGVTISYPCSLNPLDDWCTKEVCSDEKWEFDKKVELSLSPSIPTLPPLINLCESAFGPGANEASLLSCGWSQATPLLKLGQLLLEDYNERHEGDYSFASFPDENTVVIATPDLRPGVELTLPELEGTFRNVTNTKLTNQSLEGGHKLKVSGYSESVSRMSVDMISFLDYAGITTSLSMGGGKGSVDAGDVAPTFTANQRMNFEFDPVINLTINLGREMAYSVFDADGGFSHSGTGLLVSLRAGQYIEAIFPQELSQPVPVTMSSSLNGQLSTKVDQDYYKSIQVKVGKVAIPGITSFNIIDEEVAKSKFANKVIMDHAMMLEVGTLSLPAFELNPENPVIAIDYLNMEDMVNLGAGLRGVVYKMGISNQGDVPLDQLQLQFDLAQAFAGALSMEVECTSSELNLNHYYNGSSDIELLGAGNALEPGQTAMVEVLVRVKPAIAAVSPTGCFEPVDYMAGAKAYGVSPIGTQVENNFNQCTQQRTGPDLIASVDLGASVIDNINDFTLYGWQQVKIDKPQALSMGNVGSGADIIFENTSFQNTDRTVIIGDLFAAGQLFLQGQSQLEADYVMVGSTIKSPNWKSGLILNGALSENAQCVPVQPEVPIAYQHVGKGKKIQLKKGGTLELAPGTYEWVRLSEGSQLILSPGVYNIERWMFLGDDAVVTYRTAEGPIELNIGIWQALGRRNLKLVADGGDAASVTYRVAGHQKCSFHSSLVQGRILAPTAEMEFTDGTILEGTVYANKVNFKTGASFINPRYLKPLNISGDCQQVLIADAYAEHREQALQAGAPQLPDSRELNVYPNPTQGQFIIEGLPATRTLQIRVYNPLGVLVQELTSHTADLLTISLENEAPGLYTLKVEGYRPRMVVKY